MEDKPKEIQRLEVFISEDELRDLIRGSEFRWVLTTREGQDINALLRLERYKEDEGEEDDEEDEDESDF